MSEQRKALLDLKHVKVPERRLTKPTAKAWTTNNLFDGVAK